MHPKLVEQIRWTFGVIGFIRETNPPLAAHTLALLDQLPGVGGDRAEALGWFLESKRLVLDALRLEYRRLHSEDMPDDWFEERAVQ